MTITQYRIAKTLKHHINVSSFRRAALIDEYARDFRNHPDLLQRSLFDERAFRTLSNPEN